MSVPSRIVGIDPKTRDILDASIELKQGRAGIVTWTEPLYDRSFALIQALNDTHGNQMNQDASVGGTPVVIHDGTDSAAWTGTNITGISVTFDSTNRPNNGTKSVEIAAPNLNDTWMFDKGSDINLNNYVSLSLLVNVDKNWTSGDSISVFGFDTGTGLVVGNSVLLENYINEFEFDTWQATSIPLSDMGLETSTIDAIRMVLIGKHGASPTLYIDDFQVEQTGGPIKFTITPAPGKVFLMESVLVTFTDALDISVANASVAGLAFNKILGLVSLTNGYQIKLERKQIAIFTNTVREIGDHMALGGEVTNVICDGTNTLLTIKIDLGLAPISLQARNEDNISFTINDDMSGLTGMQVVAVGKYVQDASVSPPNIDEDDIQRHHE